MKYLALAMLGPSMVLLTACEGSPQGDAGADGGADAELGSEPDACAGDAGCGLEEGGAAEAGASPCESSADCATGQACLDAVCATAPACDPDCTDDHPCVVETGQCNCEDPDLDKDDVHAIACGGRDCDDTDPLVYPGATEYCFGPDPAHRDPAAATRDEDCDPRTYYRFAASDPERRPVNNDGDGDGDGFVSEACFNVDPSGQRHGGDDCNDASSEAKPGNTEVCDRLDNDCDGMIDEVEVVDDAGVSSFVPEGLQRFLYPDLDRDGYGDPDSDDVGKGCFQDPRLALGYVLQAGDCDDTRADIHPGAVELCDGVDNDCDAEGLVDTDDPSFDIDLIVRYPQTVFECTGEGLAVVDCPSPDVVACGDPLDGCDTDATRLESCRACDTDCAFSCGQEGCDERVQLSAGLHHTCALTDEGRVACWGRGLFGRLGHQSATRAHLPLFAPLLQDARALAAGARHTCAIIGSERSVWCWGDNRVQQLGSPDVFVESVVPVPVTTLIHSLFVDDFVRGVVEIAAGTDTACAVLADGRALCWGQQEDGRLGNGLTDARPFGATYVLRPPAMPGGGAQPLQGVESVCLGEKHGCALLEGGTVECWGDNGAGQLGDGSTTLPNNPHPQPVAALDGHEVDAITCGPFHTCALAGGSVYCWGDGSHGELGPRVVDAQGSGAVSDDVPAKVEGLDAAEALTAGSTHTCAIQAGAAHCWGDNRYGQLATTGEPTGVVTLVDPLLAAGVTQLTAGERHTCALLADDSAACWGQNVYGQFGNGSIDLETNPTIEPVLAAQGTGQ